MRLTVIATILILPALGANSGTYNVDDAWRQMTQISERSADDYDPLEVSPAQSRASYDSSYGGGGGYGSYGGGGHGHGGGHGYGGGGGYGHGGGGYVNQSAVALLGFLYLLNLIQDIIQDLTTTVAPGRKKRSFGDPLHEMLAGIGQGGVQSLTYEVASTILPLVSEFTDHNDKVRPKSCVQRSICSANRRLTSNYGQMGKIFARLSSEAVLEHFAIANDKTFGQAATDGRNLVDCYTVYNECKSED